MTTPSAFDVSVRDGQAIGNTLIIGQAHFGMAGVTAADYLVRHLDATQIGHVTAEAMPAIAPFEDGVPRHHSRLYAIDDTNLIVLVGELFISMDVARGYTDSLLEWADENDVDEIVVLHGVPFPHGPGEHDVFHVATPDYREKRLSEGTFRPLKGGFLDGIVGEVVTRNLDKAAPATGVFITPTHPPGPDIDAALLLLDAIEALYRFEVDETELRQLGEQLKQYYEQLADRMTTIARGEAPLTSHDFPEDRMYM